MQGALTTWWSQDAWQPKRGPKCSRGNERRCGRTWLYRHQEPRLRSCRRALSMCRGNRPASGFDQSQEDRRRGTDMTIWPTPRSLGRGFRSKKPMTKWSHEWTARLHVGDLKATHSWVMLKWLYVHSMIIKLKWSIFLLLFFLIQQMNKEIASIFLDSKISSLISRTSRMSYLDYFRNILLFNK